MVAKPVFLIRVEGKLVISTICTKENNSYCDCYACSDTKWYIDAPANGLMPQGAAKWSMGTLTLVVGAEAQIEATRIKVRLSVLR